MIDFVGIGAQKAGTTWLYEHLRRHPTISFPAGKEVHFWDRHRQLGVDWWLSKFPGSAGPVVRGEITPAYAILDRSSIEEIRRLCPRIRLFFSMRNPMARAWSAALSALQKAEMEYHEASDRWFLDHFNSQGSRRRGAYLECLDAWLSAFPHDQLHVIWFDDIVAKPREVLQALACHLGVDPNMFGDMSEELLRAPVYTGSGHVIREVLLRQLQDLYSPEIERLALRYHRDLSSWLEWPSPIPCAK
jgi:hypothetical protein